MFFDNFLLQNAYQDRISRLSQGQYSRSLTLCPATTVLFPDGSPVSSVTADGVSIAALCGQPIGGTVSGTDGPVVVSDAIQHLQQQYLAAQAALTGGPNVYSLSNSLANFGGMLAPNFRTPRVVHMSAGMQRQLGEHSMFSIDYVREIGTQYPLGIDTNHVGDARHLDSVAALAAINATVTRAGCLPAGSAGSESQAAIQCYINSVPGASIVDFARNGLDSGNAFCGPFPCSVLGLPEPAFGGIHSTVDPADPTKVEHLGSNLMYFPTGRSKYVGVHATFRTSGDRLARGGRPLGARNPALGPGGLLYLFEVPKQRGSGGRQRRRFLNPEPGRGLHSSARGPLRFFRSGPAQHVYFCSNIGPAAWAAAFHHYAVGFAA